MNTSPLNTLALNSGTGASTSTTPGASLGTVAETLLLDRLNPIVPGTSTSFTYRLFLLPDAADTQIVQLEGPLLEDAWPARRRTLISTDRTAAYEIRVDDRVRGSEALVFDSKPVDQGHHEDLYLLALNGREFQLQVDADGNPTLTALGINFPWLWDGAPILADDLGRGWAITARDGGILDNSRDPEGPIIHRQRAVLRAQDNSKAWQITVNNDGILFVTDVGVSLQDTQFFEARLVSPSNIEWLVRVNGDGILFVDSLTDHKDARDEWPLVIADRAGDVGTIYIPDDRFAPPLPGVGRHRYGWRRRVMRGRS